MVRWPAGLHAQAARRNTSTFSWRPGFLGSGAQPINALPIRRYTQKISGVPLTGGQAQGIIGGFPGNTVGPVTSPPAFTVLAFATIPVAGRYTLQWSVALSGTLSAGDADNFGVGLDGVDIGDSVNAAAAGNYPQAPIAFDALAGSQLAILNLTDGTSGSIYSAAIAGASSPLTLQVGPQALGTTWYPVSVTLSTSTGALDTSTALVYLGPSATPATLQSTVYSGNGTAALAIPAMSPGQTIIVTWTGGHAGDTAALNITGTMDALSTG